MTGLRRIVLVEDDILQAQSLAEDVIWTNFEGSEIRYFDSEFSFQKAIHSREIANFNPTHAIIDLLIRYYSIADLESLEQPPSFDDLPDAISAGYRCRDRLLEECENVKCVVATVMEGEQRHEGVVHKGNEAFFDQIIAFLEC